MLSVVVLTKNEEKNILDCLESISWADEIIIADDYSDDRTLEVIKKLEINKKIKIFKRRLENDFSTQRNYFISKTKFDWILYLDADEIVTQDLREEINTVLINEKNNPTNFGFYIPRKDLMWGKLIKHGEMGKIKLLRLMKKGSGRWEGKIHERYETNKKTSELENYILHRPHQSINEFINEINFYTSVRAKELFDKGVKTSFWEIIIYPKAKFFVNFFINLGFLDGIEGLVLAILMSLHSFLVRAKLWLLINE